MSNSESENTEPNTPADIYLKALETYWNNFDKRRSYEWKFALALWAAILGFNLVLIKGEAKADVSLNTVIFIAASFFILVLHFFFIWGITRANRVDKKKAETYEGCFNKILKINFAPSKSQTKNIHDCTEVIEAINCANKWGGGGKWSAFVEMGITLVLLVGTIWLQGGIKQQLPSNHTPVDKVQVLFGEISTVAEPNKLPSKKNVCLKINYGTGDVYILDESTKNMPKFTKIKQD